MATLRLNTLTCYETEDEFGPDEAYIKVNGDKVWGPTTMTGARDAPVNHEASFSGEATVQLWDEDRFSDDDLLGTWTVREDEAGAGEQEARFTYDRSHYKLTYEVA
jgi:hypothetical protein